MEHRRDGTVTLTRRDKEEAAAIFGRYILLNAFFKTIVGVNAVNPLKFRNSPP